MSLRTGTMILGFFTLFGLLSEIENFLPIRMAANAIAAIAFLIMFMDDAVSRRKLFFFAYMVSQIVTFVYQVFMAQD